MWPQYADLIIQLAKEKAIRAGDLSSVEKFETELEDDENNFKSCMAFHALFYMLPQTLDKMMKEIENGSNVSKKVQDLHKATAAKKKKEKINTFITGKRMES